MKHDGADRALRSEQPDEQSFGVRSPSATRQGAKP